VLGWGLLSPSDRCSCWPARVATTRPPKGAHGHSRAGRSRPGVRASRFGSSPLREFQTFDAAPRYCVPCGRAALGQAYDRAGRPDSAVAAYERYITTPDLVRLGEWRLGDDGTQLAPAHKRLGELYEQQGDRAKAKHHYSQFVELWKDCDPELKSSVVEVRRRLRHLGG
jgi:tetratricopeptide (TPR) repeat protein